MVKFTELDHQTKIELAKDIINHTERGNLREALQLQESDKFTQSTIKTALRALKLCFHSDKNPSLLPDEKTLFENCFKALGEIESKLKAYYQQPVREKVANEISAIKKARKSEGASKLADEEVFCQAAKNLKKNDPSILPKIKEGFKYETNLTKALEGLEKKQTYNVQETFTVLKAYVNKLSTLVLHALTTTCFAPPPYARAPSGAYTTPPGSRRSSTSSFASSKASSSASTPNSSRSSSFSEDVNRNQATPDNSSANKDAKDFVIRPPASPPNWLVRR